MAFKWMNWCKTVVCVCGGGGRNMKNQLQGQVLPLLKIPSLRLSFSFFHEHAGDFVPPTDPGMNLLIFTFTPTNIHRLPLLPVPPRLIILLKSTVNSKKKKLFLSTHS